MATEPKDKKPEENLHGEPESTPLFKNEGLSDGYDNLPLASSGQSDNTSDDPASYSQSGGRSFRSGNNISSNSAGKSTRGIRSSSAGASSGGATDSTSGRAESAAGLARAEKSGGVSGRGAVGGKEKEVLGKGFNPHDTFTTPQAKLAGLFLGMFKSKKAKGGAVTGGIVGIALALMAIGQGPFEFIQFAQLMQRFHFRSNEEFGDDRSYRTLIYTLLGAGERGRLGTVANVAADRWEKKLEVKHGIRPIYNDTGRRLGAGFEITDRDKAAPLLSQLQEVLGDKAEILQVKDIQGTSVRSKAGRNIDPDATVLRYKPGEVKPKDIKLVTRTVFKATGNLRVTTSIATRMAIKRYGANFHTWRNYKFKKDAKADKKEQQKQREEQEKKLLDDHAESVREGVITGAASGDEGKEAVENAEKESEGKTKEQVRAIRSAAVKAGGPVAVIGIVCGAQSFGEDANAAKYKNNVVPQMRMGISAVAMGNQVMSGDDFNIEEIGVFKKQFFDKESETSWVQSTTVRQQQGKKPLGGEKYDTPDEARLDKVGDKPDFFEVLDTIAGVPVLSQACDALEAIAGLPVIKQLSEGAIALINIPIRAATGNTTEDFAADLIGVINGKAVDPLAKGSDFGNLANTGSFLAGNDQAMSMGGRGLSNDEVAELNASEESIELEEEKNKSFAQRYFDPNSNRSLVGSVFLSGNSEPARIAATLGRFDALGSFVKVLSSAFPKVGAESAEEIYGVKKYGFSLGEQNDQTFENPLENGAWVEEGNRLEELNEKYGKCFSMSVTKQGSGISLSTDESPNVFNLEESDEYKDCRKKDSEEFNRYRFYLADAVAAKSLACFEADDETACSELGVQAVMGQSADTEIAEADIEIYSPALSTSGKITPKGVTLHWWGGSGGGNIDSLANTLRSRGYSVQLGITEDGKVYQLTKNLDDYASHATGGNTTTIGIEIEGAPADFGRAGIDKYPKKFEAVVSTVKYLVDKYNIPLEGEVVCGNVSGVHPHKAYNSCPGAAGKIDIDDYYFNKVMERVRE